MDALKLAKYQHTRTIRLWKTGCEDEGVRSTAAYIKTCPSVAWLELLDCGVTSLGCEFLAEILLPEARIEL